MANDFSLEGAKWGSPELGTAGGIVTWAVDDSISQTEMQSINAAFAEWSEVANIQFQQVSSTTESDIDFSEGAIDGASNILGVTSYSYSGGQLQSADIEFDSADNLSGSEFSLVAIHEIGHAIGLGHFNDDDAVMNSTANFGLDSLTQSDIDGIVALYGANTTDMADAGGTGTTPPDTVTPDGGTGATPDTPTTPTADAGDGDAGGCGGTQTAAGDGATGTGADAGTPDGFGGDLGGRFADLGSLLRSMQGDDSDGAAASGADLASTQIGELINLAHQHFDNHLWG
ncbi:matrixin family metalloprotease [Bradyrhizobium roseum]|uniref:matrixin family metalloprotease n=1 Tax=Bradyrhizobium roseum TaxID=3056648 RepID=UPI00260F840E|nr:matrixin family metalloprotease [Bradyrhizobium roseus]WKA26583.1 matrixin family metalloprotease [Bradyrhizobium roseus]